MEKKREERRREGKWRIEKIEGGEKGEEKRKGG